jgi:hypothetical protein
MCLCMLTCGLDLTGIAEAETQQDFMDVLDKDVIEPLTALKVKTRSCILYGNPVVFPIRPQIPLLSPESI